jgi:glucosamine--fructose-6-phosphate aminotransferase (isomerizing)
VLEDNEFAVTTIDGVEFYSNARKQINKSPLAFDIVVKKPDKAPYTTFMEKEIFEIPEVIKNIAKEYSTKNLDPLRERLRTCDTIHIAACGTSYHAGLYIAQLLEAKKIRARVYIASELLHITRICNVEGSSIWRYADASLPTVAGVEVAVASTKAFAAQTIVGEILAKGYCEERLDGYIKGVERILGDAEKIRAIAKEFKNAHRIFLLGCGLSTIISAEGALKVKEITYRHCEGYAAGELKHGTLALVDDKTLCIIMDDRIKNAIAQVTSRGAKVWQVPIDEAPISVIYPQLFALYSALEHKLDPDKPRNLAKSVTV